MLDGIEGIMNLAAASGEDLATTSDIVTDALTALGLSAADSGHFADILAAASSNANTNVSMTGETFKYCAPVAGALGFTAEDTVEAIGLMANAGIKSSQAGTAMRTMLTNLIGEVTFHNGRSGNHGIYNPRHNDRRFDVENSEHIDAERAKQNVYGIATVAMPPAKAGRMQRSRISALRKLNWPITRSITATMWMRRMPGMKRPGTQSATAPWRIC